MSITDQEVARVADLVRVRFSPDERAVLAAQMNQILQYFESLDDVETEGIEPMQALQPANALRCDEERLCMPLPFLRTRLTAKKIFSKFQKS